MNKTKFLTANASAMWIMSYIGMSFPQFHFNLSATERRVLLMIYDGECNRMDLENIIKIIKENGISCDGLRVRVVEENVLNVLDVSWIVRE